jgi:hypothetical protein
VAQLAARAVDGDRHRPRDRARVGSGEPLLSGTAALRDPAGHLLLVDRALPLAQELHQRTAPRAARVAQRHAVLRPPRAGEARLHLAEVELQVIAELRRRGRGRLVEALRLRVRADQLDEGRVAPAQPEVGERLVIDREEADGRAVLRRHVGDGRAVGEREARDAGPVELDELADDAPLAEHLRHSEHDVGRRRAGGQRAVQAEADHLRDEHDRRLPEHRRLGLDPADAPADDAEPVDHRRVRVGAEHRVGVDRAGAVVLVAEDDGREEFEVNLMDDPGIGRDDAEVAKRLLAPAQERVALAVARELELDVPAERVGGAEVVDLHGVIDDQVRGLQRVDARRIAAERAHRVAHRGEIDDRGHAGEVL